MSVSKIIVMGVSGCGKSLIGTRLAERLQVPFFDADDFHSPANVAKMASGVPLTDSDRSGWLDDLAELVQGEQGGLVLACSALKRAYRDRLRSGNPSLQFVYLKGDMETIWSRHSSRKITTSMVVPCSKVSFVRWRSRNQGKGPLSSTSASRPTALLSAAWQC